MMTHASRLSGRTATTVTTAPAGNAAAETPIASCSPVMNVPRAITVPNSATPIAPPACRAALSTPEAIPTRLAAQQPNQHRHPRRAVTRPDSAEARATKAPSGSQQWKVSSHTSSVPRNTSTTVESSRRYRLRMRGDAHIAAVGSLVADPGRARILLALGDGLALPATVLADEASVAASTASSHLAKLVDGGLLTVERHGRHRYFRLAGPHVAELIETLARVAPATPVRSLRQGNRAEAVRSARTCYDHLAGVLGAELMSAMLEQGLLAGGDGQFDHAPARTASPRQASISTTGSPIPASSSSASSESTSTHCRAAAR